MLKMKNQRSMQLLKINDPETEKELKIEAAPVKLEDQQGWTLRFEEGRETTIITDQHGIWKQVDGSDLNPTLISAIGEAIEKNLTSGSF